MSCKPHEVLDLIKRYFAGEESINITGEEEEDLIDAVSVFLEGCEDSDGDTGPTDSGSDNAPIGKPISVNDIMNMDEKDFNKLGLKRGALSGGSVSGPKSKSDPTKPKVKHAPSVYNLHMKDCMVKNKTSNMVQKDRFKSCVDEWKTKKK